MNIWRHPRPRDVAGRCIGRTDVPVDPRKAKRLAHRIRRWARRTGAPRVVATSPLQRGSSVGRWLKHWGWQHVVDARLCEMDFGTWDGCTWVDIGAAAVDAWCADFMHHRAGGGESVTQLLARCDAFLAQPERPLCAVGHAGWISAATWLTQHRGEAPSAADWPAAVRYGACVSMHAPVAITD